MRWYHLNYQGGFSYLLNESTSVLSRDLHFHFESNKNYSIQVTLVYSNNLANGKWLANQLNASVSHREGLTTLQRTVILNIVWRTKLAPDDSKTQPHQEYLIIISNRMISLAEVIPNSVFLRSSGGTYYHLEIYFISFSQSDITFSNRNYY